MSLFASYKKVSFEIGKKLTYVLFYLVLFFFTITKVCVSRVNLDGVFMFEKNCC